MAVKPNDVITDGTVKWTVRKLGGNNGNPTGTILAFAGNGALPDGFLLCDGSAVSRTLYADLFAVCGTLYGAGDGSTTFNLPNISAGRVLEGRIQTENIGVYKTAGLPNITGYLGKTELDEILSALTGAFYASRTRPTYTWADVEYPYGSLPYVSMNAALSNPIYGASDTVQPASLSTRFIIKY